MLLNYGLVHGPPTAHLVSPSSGHSVRPNPSRGRLRDETAWEDLARTAGYDLRNLARICNVSTRTLQRYFARHALHAGEWLHQLRLAHAFQQLLSGEPVKSAAFDAGYKHLSNFSRDFKKLFGICPRAAAASCFPKTQNPSLRTSARPV